MWKKIATTVHKCCIIIWQLSVVQFLVLWFFTMTMTCQHFKSEHILSSPNTLLFACIHVVKEFLHQMKCPLCFTVLSVLACWELFSTSLSFSTWLNSGSPGIAWGQKYLWEAKISNSWLHDTHVNVCITLVKIHKIYVKCCQYPQDPPNHEL